MRHVRTLLSIAAVAAIPALAAAQSIAGVLIISEAGVPAPNARVWLTTTRGILVDSARSDAQGHFTVSAARPGRYILNVRRLGYFPEETDPIRLDEGAVVTDTVYLLSARVLQPVDVIVRREVSSRFGVDIRSLSSSQVITAEEIDRYRPFSSTLEDLLRWNAPPSMTIVRGRDGPCFQLRHRGCATVYVDGLPWGPAAWMPANEIESIIVLRGSDAFARFGRADGVIAVFTNIWASR